MCSRRAFGCQIPPSLFPLFWPWIQRRQKAFWFTSLFGLYWWKILPASDTSRQSHHSSLLFLTAKFVHDIFSNKKLWNLSRGIFFKFTLFNTVLSAAPQIPLYWRMLESNQKNLKHIVVDDLTKAYPMVVGSRSILTGWSFEKLYIEVLKNSPL